MSYIMKMLSGPPTCHNYAAGQTQLPRPRNPSNTGQGGTFERPRDGKEEDESSREPNFLLFPSPYGKHPAYFARPFPTVMTPLRDDTAVQFWQRGKPGDHLEEPRIQHPCRSHRTERSVPVLGHARERTKKKEEKKKKKKKRTKTFFFCFLFGFF